jgi:alpha-D-ribose 1-methylphosphonate 5-triphosphate synthase subunit PhnH
MTDLAFDETAVQSSQVFRTTMSAMSRPGKIHAFRPSVTSPQPLLPGAAAILVTLCDFHTPIYLAAALAGADVEKHLRFRTGAPIASHPSSCSFAVLAAGPGMPALTEFPQGTHAYPDRSATLIIQVPHISNGDHVTLSGPGIKSAATLDVGNLDDGFWQAMMDNHAGFPIGVDVIFVSPTSICACPRSISIRISDSV